MNKSAIKVLASVGLLLTASIWGFAFVVVKDSLDYIGPVWMIAFRFSIAAIASALIYIKKFKKLTPKILLHGGLLGLYLFLAYFFQTIGCNYTTAGKNAFLTTIYVFLVPLFSWPVTKKRPTVYVFLCALLSIVGIGLLGLNSKDATSINIGDILTLICGIFYAIHITFTAKYDETEDPILLSVLQFVFAALFGWIAAPFVDGAFPVQGIMNAKVVISMLYLGILSTMVAFTLQNVSLKYLPSHLASLFLSFESVFGVFFGIMILKEAFTFRMFIGCLLIFVSVVLAQMLPSQKNCSPN